MGYLEEYQRWMNFATEDGIHEELSQFSETQILDSFYRDLSFGTGGLRGTIGAGTNRLNVYTVGKASQGLAYYLLKRYGEEASVVIGYDSRLKSDLFAQTAASVLAANNIKVYYWSQIIPVPTVSFATRFLKTSAGIMITASHNPSKYNGYKVYGDDGCQITTEAAAEIYSEIKKVDLFEDIKIVPFDIGIEKGLISFIDDSVLTEYIDEVKKQSVLFGDEVDKDVAIVYSPLNGTGYIPVTRTLSELGFSNITLVEEQKLPDGQFPTCPYPNPEVKEAMLLGMEYAKRHSADLFLATDPDCDRVGIAVKAQDGEYTLLSANETGILLLDYICSQRAKHNQMPDNPVMIKTIVTMDLGFPIAESYGVKTIDVLTGFKFIGEQICQLEEKGMKDSFIFGFEESYGYLSGTYVRDKDGVNASALICEMYAYYKSRGISLLDKLNELFERFGYCLNTQHSFVFEGASGSDKMQRIMDHFHHSFQAGDKIAGKEILQILDFSKGLNGLPKSDVLKYLLQDHCSVVVRPSGTEPKLKTYFSISASAKDIAVEIEKEASEQLQSFFQ